MYLLTVLAFALLFLRAEQPVEWLLVGPDDRLETLCIVWLQPLLVGLGAFLSVRRTRRLLDVCPDQPHRAQQWHHRTLLLLRVLILIGFAVSILVTPWPAWFDLTSIAPAIQIVGDGIVLLPFLAAALAVWIGAFPAERRLRGYAVGYSPALPPARPDHWRFSSYLDFQLRHHFLVVAVPMALILFAANMTRGYRSTLQAWTGWVATPDVLLGAVAAGIFVVAPLLLRRIWRTRPLESGAIRERLETICNRIGMGVRDILVWKSDGMIVNAAVMGVFAPVRYVLLSDGLLNTMDDRHVEAVFGHEAGHVRHRHLQHFLVFGVASWLLVAGIMELAARLAVDVGGWPDVPLAGIQAIGLAATVAVWGIGFGWLSRRFERQADLFGAACVAPPVDECHIPCSVHAGFESKTGHADRVCATGAAVFATALDRVAILNGIPHDERSWRHSSIGSRIRFLFSMAGDPASAISFQRSIRRIKTGMLVAAALGSAIGVLYFTDLFGP